MDYEHFVVAAARVVEFTGVVVMLAGALIASLAFARRLVRHIPPQEAYHALRADLGRAILLGLELVIADIVSARWRSSPRCRTSVLAVIVAIRTLSFALELEVSGRWPWQPRPPAQDQERSL